MSEGERVRRLAELKAYVEKRAHELEQELSKLRSLEEIVDLTLAEKSFRRVEIPKTQSHPAQPSTTPQVAPSTPQADRIQFQAFSIRTASGIELADMQVSRDEIKVVPKAQMKFDPSAPPLRAFLVGRVLEPMRLKDQNNVQVGQMTEDKILSYTVDNGTELKQIIIKNYGDEKRLQELRSAISWTIRRMYERKVGT
jgi:hypothetical protein